jgi:hypothetical protein
VKARIIKALDYPREYVRSNLMLEGCPHNSMYDDVDGRCLSCDDRFECEWLLNNDEFAALEQKPEKQLLQALGFAVELVTAEITRWEHDSGRCHCEACTWLRETQQLYDEVQLV